jgi:hypothetical protein
MVCGFHASVHDRAVKKLRDAEEAKAQRETVKQKTNEKCQRLQSLGIEATPYYHIGFGSTPGYYSGQVIVNPDQVLDKLNTCAF